MAQLAAYNFDESGTTVLDRSVVSGGLDFSIAVANVTRVAGRTGSGLRSTGATPATLPDVGRTTLRSLSAWLEFPGSIAASWPIRCNVAALDSGGWGVLFLPPNIVIQARNAATFVRASAAWDGGPHHVAGTYDGSAVRLYLDGVLQGAPVALTGPLRTDTEPPELWAGTGVMASGYIDDLRFHDSVLSAAEIVTEMNTPVTAPSEPEPEEPPAESPDPPAAQGGQGWESLRSIFDAAVTDRETSDASAPLACPNDGEPLKAGPDGELRCPFDGWMWDGRPIRY